MDAFILLHDFNNKGIIIFVKKVISIATRDDGRTIVAFDNTEWILVQETPEYIFNILQEVGNESR